jgi:hypothetical protein
LPVGFPESSLPLCLINDNYSAQRKAQMVNDAMVEISNKAEQGK